MNYIGKPGDYFDFRNDGKLYLKESLEMDTLAYQLLPGNMIRIQGFGSAPGGESTITLLSKSRATIQTPPPGGEWATRVMVNLQR